MARAESKTATRGAVPGYCALCRAKEIELYGTLPSNDKRKHKDACKRAGCKHPAYYTSDEADEIMVERAMRNQVK